MLKLKYLKVLFQLKDFPKVLGERSIRFDLIHSKGAMRYGLSDVTPLDDFERNFFEA